MRILALAVMLAFGGVSAANAAGTSIDISSGFNSNLYTFTGGDAYPPAGSTVTIEGAQGGIDFKLGSFYAGDPNAPDVGVVLTGDGAPTTVTIDTADILLGTGTAFYSLINSGFGEAGSTIGDLTFNLSSGQSVAYSLIEGSNVRDHYNGMYNNVATDVYGTNTYQSADAGLSYDRLDAQQIVLGSQYAGDTVTSITLNNTDPAGGNPFLVALSVVDGNPASAVPEPASWALMIGGIGLIGGLMRRDRRSPLLA